LLLLLGLLRLGSLAPRATTAFPPPPATLSFRTRRLLLLLRGFALWPLLWPRGVLMWSGLSAPSSFASPSSPLPATLRLLRPRVGPGGTSAARAPLVAALAPCSLLELLDFALHEAARLRVLAVAEGVVPTIGTALPTLGIRFLAGGAKDAFR
jgi:hypothetical protein